MKRVGNIYTNILEKENIRKAILSSSKGKRNRNSVKTIIENIDFYVCEIYEILKDNRYIPSPYVKLKIHDGARKKERVIFKPRYYPDQVVHWALMLQLEPIIKRGMYDYSCASIPNRGIHYGAKFLKRILVVDRKNTKYALKIDVKKFYPSVNKDILIDKFKKIIKDKETLNLIKIIIDSSESGLPIGNYTSQWFANFYLQDLDHYIKEVLKVKYYIRYMDDMILFHRNKKELRKIKEEIEKFLNKEKLVLKENWQLFKVDSRPIDFIGYRFYRGHTTLRRGNFLRIKRRAKKIYKRKLIRHADAAAMISYSGWLKHCNSFNFSEKYVKPYVDLNTCKGVIKNACTKQCKTTKKF